MLNNPTLDKLRSLKLTGMADAFAEQLKRPVNDLDFEERLGLLVEREYLLRDNRKMERRLKQARLQLNACMEDIDFKHPRGLNKSAMLELFRCQWVSQHLNLLITGPTGCGKTYIACALAHKACITGCSSRYYRLPRLWNELKIAKANGSYPNWLASIAKVDVLVLDDWGLVAPDEEQRRDLLEILEDRYQKRSTIITSQLAVALWHEHLGDATLADAVLDRLVHNSIRIELNGESLRKPKKSLQTKPL
ncbi:TPA: IS21-like element helper ATPase IstB [Legionella anisa]